MQVSIVILNYNYARFVGQAIESALGQSYRGCDVVVVDNGSTDDSLAVIGRYAQRIRLVCQERNIGQGQGYNLGFEAARGDWIIWLDADDLLDKDAIATCMALAGPDTAKVQFPLRLVDSNGRELGGMVPFLRHHGDVVPIIRRFGHYAGPPGSGNLYRRSAVAPYFPVSPQDWPIGTDTVPFLVAPFHGLVADAGRPLGGYRLHRKPSSDAPGYAGNYITTMAAEVMLNAVSRDRSLELLRSRSGIVVSGPFFTLPTHVRNRIISWRLAPDAHPFRADSAASLWQLMNDSLRECPGYGVIAQQMMRVWTAGVLLLPRRSATRLMTVSSTTPRWSRLIRWTQRLRRRPESGGSLAIEKRTRS